MARGQNGSILTRKTLLKQWESLLLYGLPEAIDEHGNHGPGHSAITGGADIGAAPTLPQTLAVGLAVERNVNTETARRHRSGRLLTVRVEDSAAGGIEKV